MNVSLHVKYRLLLPDCNYTWIIIDRFSKIHSKMTFNEKSFQFFIRADRHVDKHEEANSLRTILKGYSITHSGP
jgi:hypothetical protein